MLNAWKGKCPSQAFLLHGMLRDDIMAAPGPGGQSIAESTASLILWRGQRVRFLGWIVAGDADDADWTVARGDASVEAGDLN